MKVFSALCGIIFTIYLSTASGSRLPAALCINVWDEGCVNGQLQGAGRDDDFINGNFNPGKRCVGARDGACFSGPGDGPDANNHFNDNYLRNQYNILAKLIKNAHD